MYFVLSDFSLFYSPFFLISSYVLLTGSRVYSTWNIKASLFAGQRGNVGYGESQLYGMLSTYSFVVGAMRVSVDLFTAPDVQKECLWRSSYSKMDILINGKDSTSNLALVNSDKRQIWIFVVAFSLADFVGDSGHSVIRGAVLCDSRLENGGPWRDKRRRNHRASNQDRNICKRTDSCADFV